MTITDTGVVWIAIFVATSLILFAFGHWIIALIALAFALLAVA